PISRAQPTLSSDEHRRHHSPGFWPRLRGRDRSCRLLETRVIQFADLRVERPKVVEQPNAKKANCEQIQNPGGPFAQVKPVDAKYAEEREQNPGDRVIEGAGRVTAGRGSVHRWDQKHVNEPADTKQPQ